MAMLPVEIEQMLAALEAQMEQVAVAVGDGDAAALEAASANLQRASMELARVSQEQRHLLDREPARQRLRQIAAMLTIQREGLARQAAAVERTLSVLVPSAAQQASSTYANLAGARRYNA